MSKISSLTCPDLRKKKKLKIYKGINLLQASVRAVMLTTRVKLGCARMEEEVKFRV